MTAPVLSGWYWQALCVATALTSGLLIGIERGWKLKDQEPGTRVAGVRTFTIMGLGSGIAGLLGASGTPVLVAAAIAIAMVAIMVIAYSRELRTQHDFDECGRRDRNDRDRLPGRERKSCARDRLRRRRSRPARAARGTAQLRRAAELG